jgi:hypothetical protein
MHVTARRRFIAGLSGGLAAVSAAPKTEAQAPPRVSMDSADEPRRRLAAALKELNEAEGLDVTADELARAEAYAVGALLAVKAKLRPIVLDTSLDLPVSFSARRG